MGTGSVEPISDRVGCVGGIESITVDGHRWFFGIDPSLDLVVSPLIDDEETMAAFASQHMRQREYLREGDGTRARWQRIAHDQAYWRQLVTRSVEFSDLTSKDSDREFTSEGLAAQRLTPGNHLSYLLGAAAGWPDSFFEEIAVANALTTLGVQKGRRHSYDCLGTAIATLRGAGRGAADAARLVMTRYIDLFFEVAPANWPEVFSPLRAP